jgi:hypothetical protein
MGGTRGAARLGVRLSRYQKGPPSLKRHKIYGYNRVRPNSTKLYHRQMGHNTCFSGSKRCKKISKSELMRL